MTEETPVGEPYPLASPVEPAQHKNVYAALRAVQAKIPHPPKNKTNPHFKSKYTGLDDLMDVALPAITTQGLAWTCGPTIADGKPAMWYCMAHAESETSIGGVMSLVMDKATPQGQGSGLTYARRYALECVLGTVGEEDDDGNVASGLGSEPKRSKRPSIRKSKSQPAEPMTAETKTLVREAVKANGDEAAVRVALTSVGVPDATAGTVASLVKKLTDKQGKELVSTLNSNTVK